MANPTLFRASSIGKIMASPTAAAIKAGEILSVGAKTYIRQLVAQDIFGIEFEISSKAIEKGLRVEDDSIGLLNRVRGLRLVKNTERRNDGFVTGECDLFDQDRRDGYDLKSSWSAATFPITVKDCEDTIYEWQMRTYMRLWDANRWHVAYALVNTPEDLIGYEPQAMHFFDHIPEHHRLTTWTVTRDAELEASITEKVRAARDYYREVVADFERTHPKHFEAVAEVVYQGAPPVQPAALPANPF